MEELDQVIKHVEFHPEHCNIFSYGTSKGELLLADLRARSTVKRPTKVFYSASSKPDFFTEIIEQVLHSSFSKADSNKVVVRQFSAVKVWDLRHERAPLRIVPIPGISEGNMETFYHNDMIFDKFHISSSSRSSTFVTGGYNGEFIVANWESGEQYSYRVKSSRLPNDLSKTESAVLVGGGVGPQETLETESSLQNVNSAAHAPFIKSGIYLTKFHPYTESQVMVASTCDLIVFGSRF